MADLIAIFVSLIFKVFIVKPFQKIVLWFNCSITWIYSFKVCSSLPALRVKGLNQMTPVSLSTNFSIQFSSFAQLCPTPCNPMECNTPVFPVHHQSPELAQTRVHWLSDAIQPSHPLSSPSPPALNLSQHQGFFRWVSSSHQVAKVLEFQLQHQSFQWTPRTDLL